MGKRLLDIVVAASALTAAAPLLLVAVIGIWLTSPGPIFYRAQRIARDRRHLPYHPDAAAQSQERRRRGGYHGHEFTMYKFRTMRVHNGGGAPSITAANDSRVFPFGAFLRATKIDELPQLINVLKGDMTIVGPRPEAPDIVRSHYTPDDLTTLKVPPGVTSPGTLYYYTHCESGLASDDVVDRYVQELLPAKLALDRVYIQRPTFLYDIRVILRTVVTIVTRSFGRQRFPDPPELAEADVNGAGVLQDPDRRVATRTKRERQQPDARAALLVDQAAAPRVGFVVDKKH